MPQKQNVPEATKNLLLLRRVQDADFPHDLHRFTSIELKEAGLWDQCPRPPGLSDLGFLGIALFKIQADQFRGQIRKLRDQLKDQEDYYSPLRVQMLYEPDPLKQDEIRRAAEAEEAQVMKERAQHRSQRQQPVAKFRTASKTKMWRRRDISSRPYREVLWCEPMTVMDYHQATGMSRRTVQNILHRMEARPVGRRKRPNAPATYPMSVNYKVLCAWLLKHVKYRDHRRAWLVRTWLKCLHKRPKRIRGLIAATKPVLTSLGINNQRKFAIFSDYMEKCHRVLYGDVDAANAASASLADVPATDYAELLYGNPRSEIRGKKSGKTLK